ncbi:MAG: ABC transporter ATP-binding protein [Clostridia bacterium]
MKKNKYSILDFLPMTKGYRVSFILSFLSVMFAVLLSYLTPQVVRVTVDSVLGTEEFDLPRFFVAAIEGLGGKSFLVQHIVFCALASLLLSLVSALCDFSSRYFLAKASEGSIEKIRNTLFKHIQYLPYNWHNSNQTGDIIQRCTMDVDMIKNFVNNQLQALIKTIFLIIIAFALMFPMNFQLSMIALIFIPVTLISAAFFYKIIGDKFEKADQLEGVLTSVAQENFTGVRVVRAFGRERYELDKFKKNNQIYANTWIKLSKIMGLNWGINDFLGSLQVILVTVIGTKFAVNGAITVGEFLAFVTYNYMLIWPIRELGRIIAELSKTSISATRLFDILNAELEKDCCEPKKADMTGDIEFKNVNFNYNLNSNTLKDITFTIKGGQTLGILGSTGSGKSTLMYLLDRLYELPKENGTITIGGTDIREISLNDLRKNIGIVLQEPFLFSKSFQETISDGSGVKDLDSVRKYAKFAVIDDTINSFSEAYDTQIGERGVTISGGQKQRVAIARMLMQNTAIKIFDDSLSAVDMETDAKIRNSIKNEVHGTTIIIAHRITTIMNADKIIVLDKGRIVQEGTHSELSKQDGVYKKIYDTQRSVDVKEAENE